MYKILVSCFWVLCWSLCDSKSLDVEQVSCVTSKGSVLIDVHHKWAPLGAARFMALVRDGFYTDIAFYRCVEGFLTQFGISDAPSKRHWHREAFEDDPNLNMGIKKHYVSFAGGGPNTRTSQIFFAFKDLDFLGDAPWETPFGEVVDGENTLINLHKGYGDISPYGKGPEQSKLFELGNSYIRDNFPNTDFLYSCSVVGEDVEAL